MMGVIVLFIYLLNYSFIYFMSMIHDYENLVGVKVVIKIILLAEIKPDYVFLEYTETFTLP